MKTRIVIAALRAIPMIDLDQRAGYKLRNMMPQVKLSASEIRRPQAGGRILGTTTLESKRSRTTFARLLFRNTPTWWPKHGFALSVLPRGLARS